MDSLCGKFFKMYIGSELFINCQESSGTDFKGSYGQYLAAY